MLTIVLLATKFFRDAQAGWLVAFRLSSDKFARCLRADVYLEPGGPAG